MKKLLTVLAALCIVLLTACGPGERVFSTGNSEPMTRNLYAMNTFMTLTAYGSKADGALALAAARINDLESRLSATADSSQVAKLNLTGSGQLDDELIALLRRCMELQELTGGALRPDLYRLTALWGFTTGDYRIPSDAEIEAVLEGLRGENPVVINGNTVTLGAVSIDFGAVGKGYASQQAAETLKSNGVTSALLSLGGNIQTVGLKPNGAMWRVGIQSPWDTSATAGVLTVGETAVITSGGYQRYFEEDGISYIHIMDPETGRPVENDLASVTIVAPDGTMADAFSTALFVMGREGAVQFWREHSSDFQAVLILKDGSILVTEGLKESFSGGTFETITR